MAKKSASQTRVNKRNRTSPAPKVDVDKLNTVDELDNEAMRCVHWLEAKRDTRVFLFWMGSQSEINYDVVTDVFTMLRKKIPINNEKLDVIVQCDGGEVHSAYNLALLLRRYATKQLRFIVPRWAKSAATLLVCAGDSIQMGPISELGPIDPQITQINQLERRLEQYSPLFIEGALDLIRNEFKKGHKDLANGLVQKLQFPLTLGGIHRSLKISKDYIFNLLTTRMLAGETDTEARDKKAREIAKKLVEGYSDHGYCIDYDEVEQLGLNVKRLEGIEFDVVWNIFCMYRKRQTLVDANSSKQLEDFLKKADPSKGPSGDSK